MHPDCHVVLAGYPSSHRFTSRNTACCLRLCVCVEERMNRQTEKEIPDQWHHPSKLVAETRPNLALGPGQAAGKVRDKPSGLETVLHLCSFSLTGRVRQMFVDNKIPPTLSLKQKEGEHTKPSLVVFLMQNKNDVRRKHLSSVFCLILCCSSQELPSPV